MGEVFQVLSLKFFGSVGEHSLCHFEPVASIVLRYRVAPFGSEQESVGICMWIPRLWLLLDCFLLACLLSDLKLDRTLATWLSDIRKLQRLWCRLLICTTTERVFFLSYLGTVVRFSRIGKEGTGKVTAKFLEDLA